MAVEAKSISGRKIKAEDATYETYVHHLCRCSECGDEVYLAKGNIIKPHWRHFPGQGKQCPDKSVKRISISDFNSVTHDQCRAMFKSRFLEILDIAWHDKGCLKGREASRNIATHLIPVPGNKMSSNLLDCLRFNEVLLQVDKLRKNLTACKYILNSCLDRSFEGKVGTQHTNFISDISEKQELQKWNYKDIILTDNHEKHRKICNEALEYLFGNGRQDLLKEILAKKIIMYLFSGTEELADKNLLIAYRRNDPAWKSLSHDSFPYYCIAGIIANLIHVPWERIISDLNQGVIPEIRKECQWLFPSSNLEAIKKLFHPNTKTSKTSPKGF